MKKSAIFFGILILIGISSFVNISSPDLNLSKEKAEPVLSKVPNYKIETAQKVFDRLKRSAGIFSFEKPTLYVVKKLPNSKYRMAMIYYYSGQVYLEETAYDLCTSFGKDSLNALSIFLGHELSHFFGKHGISNHYANVYEDSLKNSGLLEKLAKSLPEDKKDAIIKEVDRSLKSYTYTENEKDADLSGGFLCYLSGYQTFGIAPQLLDKTYKKVGITKPPFGYPTLEKRKEIALESDAKLKDLIDYFEMGNYLVALNEFDDAILYYEWVLEHFKSREIYNNIGVLYTLSFLKKANKKRVKFAFPIELDVDSRLSNPGTKGNEDNEKKKLLLAINFFEKATSIDDDYPIAHLNKGCAHSLLGIHADDEDLAAEEFAIATAEAMIAKRLAKSNPDFWKKTLTDSYTLNGIVEALKGNKDLANASFKEALNLTPKNHLAIINYNILNEIEEETPFAFASDNCENEEFIDGVNFKKMGLDPKKDIKDTILYKSDFDYISRWYKKFDHSKVMIKFKLNNSKQSFSSVLITDPDYKGATTRGVKINDQLKDITAKYGEPDTYFELGQGSWLIYDDCKIIFQLDGDGKLIRWCIFNQVF